MNSNILRTEENGIEYFTVVATGECAVSEIGLSKMSGVPRTTLKRWLNELSHKGATEWLKPLQSEGLKHVHKGVPKWLKPLRGMDLKLVHEVYKERKTGRAKISPIPAKTAAKFITLVARNLKTDAALDAVDAFGEIGLTSFIQSKTKWLPEQFKAAPQAHAAVNRILDTPCPWERMYAKEACTKAFKWYGAKFYWTWMYSWMTPEECCKLNLVNPPSKGKRDHKIHQHIETETRDRLKPHATRLVDFLISSTSKQDFETRMGRVFGDNQMELDL